MEQTNQSERVRRAKDLGLGVAKRLRHARELRGLTSRELAKAAHVQVSTVQRLVAGAGGNAGIATIAALAKALKVSPAWLAYGEGGGPD